MIVRFTRGLAQNGKGHMSMVVSLSSNMNMSRMIKSGHKINNLQVRVQLLCQPDDDEVGRRSDERARATQHCGICSVSRQLHVMMIVRFTRSYAQNDVT